MGFIFSSEPGKRTLFFRCFIFFGWFLVAYIIALILTPGILGLIGGFKLFLNPYPISIDQAFRIGYESRVRLSANYKDLIYYCQIFFSFTTVSIFSLFGKLPLTSKYE